MKLKYDSKKPRRVEILVLGGEVIDVPKTIGEVLARVTGFVATKDDVTEVQPTPFEHLEAVIVAVSEVDADEELINAVLALAATLTPEDAPAEPTDEPVAEDAPAVKGKKS